MSLPSFRALSGTALAAMATAALGAVAFSAVAFSAVACGGATPQVQQENPQSAVLQDSVAPSCVLAPSGATRSAERSDGPQRHARSDGASVVLADWGDRTLAYVADEDERAISVIDVDARETLSTTRLDGRPSQLMMLADGRVVVALRDTSKLAVYAPGSEPNKPMRRLCNVATAVDPVALSEAEDGRVLVASAWGRRLQIFEGAELKLKGTVKLAREPRAITLSSDQKTAFLSHSVGGRASVVDLETQGVRQISLSGRERHDLDKVKEELRKSSDMLDALAKMEAKFAEQDKDRSRFGRRASCQGFALAKSTNGRIFAPQVHVDPGQLSQRTAGYGQEHATTEVPSVAVIDAATGYPMATSLGITHRRRFRSNDVREECILPRAAAVDNKSSSLLVACWGIDSIVSYDADSPDPVGAEKRRWRVPAGPSGIAIDAYERRAVVWSQFDRSLSVIPLSGEALEASEGADDRSVRRIEVPSDREREISVAAALGRSLFHATSDTRIARDGRACASCHPDGREDGLVWATPNGPRRTIMLAGRLAGTAPYAWDGDAEQLRDHVRDTFKRLNGVGGLRSVELKALLAYLRTLPAPPAMAFDKRDPKIARGAEIFASKQAGCADCHSGADYTDNKSHDVGSRGKVDRAATFNTPSLRFVAGRAPFYHDGRFDTLGELLRDTDSKMGHTKHLADDDLDALEAFLETL